jgi:hypothetical protein
MQELIDLATIGFSCFGFVVVLIIAGMFFVWYPERAAERRREAEALKRKASKTGPDTDAP